MLQQKTNLKVVSMASGPGAKGQEAPPGSTSRMFGASAKGTDTVSMTGNEKMKKVSSKRAFKESSAASGQQQMMFADKRPSGDQDSITKAKAKSKKFEKADRKD